MPFFIGIEIKPQKCMMGNDYGRYLVLGTSHRRLSLLAPSPSLFYRVRRLCRFLFTLIGMLQLESKHQGCDGHMTAWSLPSSFSALSLTLPAGKNTYFKLSLEMKPDAQPLGTSLSHQKLHEVLAIAVPPSRTL